MQKKMLSSDIQYLKKRKLIPIKTWISSTVFLFNITSFNDFFQWSKNKKNNKDLL